MGYLPVASRARERAKGGYVSALYPFYPYTHEGVVRADAECAVIRGSNPMPGFSGHCGYCVFPKDAIPAAWHGEYNVDGINNAEAHGGLTYAEIEGGDEAGRRAALKALWAEKDARYKARKDAGEDFVSLWSEYNERGKKLAREFDYTHVVFGFDCAHYMDDWNDALRDPDYVMQLAREMRKSIAALAATELSKAPEGPEAVRNDT